ncbi:MAG: hypothetical protein BGO25_10505 [Acidobacteriales bacterium 59-55]|nr:MAG: hypothetical protein BGO25_10505 [Acidobacteriales bacterium 59-55]
MSILHPAITALAFFQATQLNLFERFLTQAVSGIDSTSITSGMQDVGYVVLLIGFLWQVYQAAMHGGDVRGLGTNLIKYVVTAVVIMNYHAIFTTINQGFVNAGNWVNSASGATNLLDNWASDLKTQYSQVGFQNLWGLVTGSTAGVLDGILIIVAYILYPVVIAIFGFFYILYGSILYIFGPIIIALMPLGATNRLAKSYAENVFIWNAWPVLYGGFGALLSAVQMGQVGQMLNQNDFLGGLGNLEGSILIGLASIIYSLAIAVIPFIAKKIVSGEVGATAGTLLGAAATALTMGVAAAEGAIAGATGVGASGAGTSQSAAGVANSSQAAGSTGAANQPTAPQRSATPSTSGPAASGFEGGNRPSSGATTQAASSPGDQVAENIRGSFGSATSSDSLKDAPSKESANTISTDQTSGLSDSQTRASGARGQNSPGGRRSVSGPTTALMRPHGLATWGAYHAARLSTKGAVGGARSAGNVVKGAAGSLANPVETSGRVGAKAGEIAGTAVNAAEKTAAVAGKVANSVTHPRDTMAAGVQAVGDATRSIASSASSSVQGSAKAIKAKFSDAYRNTRAGETGSNEESA